MGTDLLKAVAIAVARWERFYEGTSEDRARRHAILLARVRDLKTLLHDGAFTDMASMEKIHTLIARIHANPWHQPAP
jgi:hypothetical protein